MFCHSYSEDVPLTFSDIAKKKVWLGTTNRGSMDSTTLWERGILGGGPTLLVAQLSRISPTLVGSWAKCKGWGTKCFELSNGGVGPKKFEQQGGGA